MKQLGNVGKIIITENLKKQIDYYHTKIGNTEWSGVLFYSHNKGSFSSLKNLEFIADNVFLMDIGSGAYTSFKNDADIIKAYDYINDPDLKSLTGMIHSHHNMKAFFSGTDLKELEDNAHSYNFYISLVVNFNEEYACKIAIPSETVRNSSFTIKDKNGKARKINKKEKVTELLVGDLEIEIKNTIPDWIKNRIEEVEGKKEKEVNNNLGWKEAYDDKFTAAYHQYNDYFKALPKKDEFTDKLVKVLKVEDNQKTLDEIVKSYFTLDEEEWIIYLDEVLFKLDAVFGDMLFDYDEYVKLLDKAIETLKRLPLNLRLNQVIKLITQEKNEYYG